MSYNADYNKEYKRKNREKVNESNKLYRLLHPEKSKHWQSLYRNKSRFGGLREDVLQRDNNMCVNCGSKEELTVDHKDGNRQNNSIQNLQVLCLCCHGKKDVQRRRPFSEYSEIGKQKMLFNLTRRWA